MARPIMVSRSIEFTKVTVLCLNVVSAEPFNKEVEIERTYSSEKKLLDAVKKMCDTETEKVVHIVSTEVVKGLYGMSETEFLAHAVELNPETRKPLSNEK